MPLLILVPVIAAFLSAAMTVAWLVSQRPKKSGWADTIWSYSVGAGGIVAALGCAGRSPIERRLLVAVLVGVWSFRLGTHILTRTLKGKDDPRYLELRTQWGRSWKFRLFLFLQVQAAAAFLLVIAVLAAALNDAPAPAWSDWVGAALLIAAIGGESIADWQLRRFAMSNSSNKCMINDQGLWSWSRHPNYFFEWLGWCAYPIIAIGPAAIFTWGWAALIGPALMYVLLVHASGIPPTEAHMLRSRGEPFKNYQRRVNAFFPGPPRR